MGDNSNKKLMLIDGNSILNRAYYGLQGRNMLQTKDGLYTNAVYGFLTIFYKYFSEENPDQIAVAFDLKAPTFRHEKFEDYKGKRKPMPEELAMQVPIIKEVIDTMQIKRYEVEGFEADDIIGTIAKRAEDKGIEVVIVTGDKDSFQLASDKTKIFLPVTKGGKTETQVYGPDEVFERYQAMPNQMIDIKGLMGDPSDNIPGVPGIGEKTAIKLISEYGSIEGLYENIDSVEKKGVHDKLVENKELAILSKKLSTIYRDVPLEWEPEDVKPSYGDKEALLKLFKKLEFKSLVKRFGLDEVANKVNEEKSEKLMDVLSEVGESYEASTEEEMKEVASIFQKEVDGLKDDEALRMVVLGDVSNSKNNIMPGVQYNRLYLFTDNKTFATINILEEGSLGEGVSEGIFASTMKDILTNKKVHLISYDIKSIVLYFKNLNIEYVNLEFDVRIAGYVLDPGDTKADITSLAQKYGDVDITDAIKEGNKLAEANAIVLMADKMKEAISENNQDELFYNIEMPLIEVLADFEHEGFNVDKKTLYDLGQKLDKQIAEETAQIYELAGEEFNINSPKQLGAILFEKLNLPAKKKTKTGYSTNIDVLEDLKMMHPIINRIIDYRQYVKLKSTYIDGLLAVVNQATGKIHSSFNQTITATGRLSSTEPNLQNIPVRLELGREVRKAFIPSADSHILLDADYSQIELRVLAHIADDENMINAFKENKDIHTITASQVFGVDEADVTPKMRGEAKAVNFGIVYGIGDFSLAKDIGVTRKEAREYIDNYLNHFKGVKKYMADIVDKAKQDGYVTTMFNRRRYIPELKSSNFNTRSFGERVALNTPIQGTAADIIKIAMVKVYDELRKKGLKSRLISQVHDELIIDTDIAEKEEVADILKTCMENAIQLKVPLIVEVKEGENWFYAKWFRK